MTINSKQSCQDNLCGNFTRSAIWRRGLQAKYPNDARNGRAASTLETLASETNDLTDEAWLQLKPYFNWSCGKWSDAVSLASRHVEFQRNLKTLPAYVNHLAEILAEQNAVAA
jgi:hypothetical protein